MRITWQCTTRRWQDPAPQQLAVAAADSTSSAGAEVAAAAAPPVAASPAPSAAVQYELLTSDSLAYSFRYPVRCGTDSGRDSAEPPPLPQA